MSFYRREANGKKFIGMECDHLVRGVKCGAHADPQPDSTYMGELLARSQALGQSWKINMITNEATCAACLCIGTQTRMALGDRR